MRHPIPVRPPAAVAGPCLAGLRTVVATVTVLAALATGAAAAPAEPSSPNTAAVAVESTRATPGVGPVLTGVRAVATGQYQACALLGNQRVRCWGQNETGTLGDGTTTSRPTAALVRNAAGTGPLSGVLAVTAGSLHTCALLTNRQVRCWGDNRAGQLGIGTAAPDALLPAAVLDESGASRLRGVAQITAGDQSTCALLVSGQVRCWGENAHRQLGDGGTTPSSLPVAVSSVTGGAPLTDITQIDAGAVHVCARRSDGTARCWGENLRATLGDGTAMERARPVAVVNGTGSGPLTGIRRITAGGTFTCAELVNGAARCWGDGQYGQIGDGQTADRRRPTPVRVAAGGPPLRGITHLEAAYGHACARLTNGQARCWGDNSYAQLGNGIPAGPNVASPRPVRNVAGPTALTGVTHLRTNSGHACVRTSTGRALCWGYGDDGQLGNGTEVTRNRPVAVRLAVP
jgi:alpha-tubulin suppressor-like RCC1 family protein